MYQILSSEKNREITRYTYFYYSTTARELQAQTNGFTGGFVMVV